MLCTTGWILGINLVLASRLLGVAAVDSAVVFVVAYRVFGTTISDGRIGAAPILAGVKGAGAVVIAFGLEAAGVGLEFTLIEGAFVVVVALSVGGAATVIGGVHAFAVLTGVERTGFTVVAGIIVRTSANGFEDAGVLFIA